MVIREMMEEERPRERISRNGAGALSDAELIAVLLRIGSAGEGALELSQRLLAEAGGLSGLAAMSPSALIARRGLGPAKAAALLAAFEIGRRFMQQDSEFEMKPILTPGMVCEIMLPVLKGLRNEECWVLFLNVSCYLVYKYKVSSGGWNSTTIDIRDIARLALEHSAVSIILVHNHPGGNPRPSAADIRCTEKLKVALNTLEIALQDHVIIAGRFCFSFSEDRMFTVPR